LTCPKNFLSFVPVTTNLLTHMKHLYPVIFAGVMMLFSSAPLRSQEFSNEVSTPEEKSGFGMAIGLKSSSFGFGGEIVAAVSPKIHLRLGGTYMRLAFAYQDEGFALDGDNKILLGSVSLIADWQFSKNAYLCAGVLHSMNSLTLTGVSTRTFTIGAISVDPDKVGSLTYDIKANMPLSPYLGFGLGRNITKDGLVGFAIEVGVVYQGSPEVNLVGTGMISPTASEEQRQILEDNVSDVTLYPMLSAQLTFKIF
jgi:hypothetical protein